MAIYPSSYTDIVNDNLRQQVLQNMQNQQSYMNQLQQQNTGVAAALQAQQAQFVSSMASPKSLMIYGHMVSTQPRRNGTLTGLERYKTAPRRLQRLRKSLSLLIHYGAD